jgi:hypothetical protein
MQPVDSIVPQKRKKSDSFFVAFPSLLGGWVNVGFDFLFAS